MRNPLVLLGFVLGLGACAAEATPPANTPQPASWAQPAPTPGAPMTNAPPPAGTLQPGTAAAPASPWAALLPPGFTLPAIPPLAFPGAPQAPTPSAPPPAAPAAPPSPPPAPPAAAPFGLPGFPGLPTAWPTATPPMPAGFPAVPGLGWPPGGQPRAGLTGDVGQRCVDDINGYRATKGLGPLARWSDGEACAAQQAGDDSRSQRPHGTFGACKEMSQNACPNWSGSPERMTDDCLKMMWSEGPGPFPAHGHYNNMVDARVTKVACGTYTMPDGRLWAVQDFR